MNNPGWIGEAVGELMLKDVGPHRGELASDLDRFAGSLESAFVVPHRPLAESQVVEADRQESQEVFRSCRRQASVVLGGFLGGFESLLESAEAIQAISQVGEASCQAGPEVFTS